MIQKNMLSKLLRVFTSLIEEFNDEEMDKFLSGKGKLIYKSSTKPKEERATVPTIDHVEILSRLSECNDREEARNVLSTIPNKESLTAIAKSQKIHIVKYDRREDIENKLIEFVIGAKLRTEAIHSLNMKSGNKNG